MLGKYRLISLISIVSKCEYGIFSKMSTITVAKAALRKEIKNRLAQLTLEEKERQSEVVISKLLSHPKYKESNRVSVFLSMSSEIQTRKVIEDIFKTGRNCFIPRYNGPNMEMVKLNSLEDFEGLPVTKWNIKQPSESDVRENAFETGDLDLIIVPGVAFTASGCRLGHGKGYYDSFLKKCMDMQTKPPATIAVAFKEQIMPDIPITDHDKIIDYVLYPDA